MMAEYPEFTKFIQELEEELQDPYKRIMVTINIASMMSPFELDDEELSTFVSDILALKAERDAAQVEAGAVALALAALGSAKIALMNRDKAGSMLEIERTRWEEYAFATMLDIDEALAAIESKYTAQEVARGETDEYQSS